MTSAPKTTSSLKDSFNSKDKTLRWHVLGGNNKHRIGANCGLCVYEETDASGRKQKRALLFDAGLLSGDPKSPEHPVLADSDTVIPDLTKYLRKKDDPSHQPETAIDSIFLTHNHSDHLGALPFLILMGYEMPKIYATPYTAKRLEQELSNAGLAPDEWPRIYPIAAGQPVQEGPVKVTAFWVSHSTPQSVGFFIETPEGNILNPGDFKLDPSVLWGPAFSEEQFNRIVSAPVDLLLLDSTGADRDIQPITEADVRDTLRELMAQYPDKRFVIAVMSGFEENLASVAKVASEHDRTLWIAGWSHEQALSALKETGMSLQDYIDADIDIRVLQQGKQARDLAAQPSGKGVIVVTGAQGKPNAVLTRAAEGRHNAFSLDPQNDIVLFCAPSIPGHEGGRERLFALLRNAGIQHLTRKDADLYAHAHARLPEIIEMAGLAKAKTVVPIHGDNKLREDCAAAMVKKGQRTLSIGNGGTLSISKDEGVHVVPSPSEQNPDLIGFKTLQGTGWTDRHYLMTKTPKTSEAENPANQNNRKRPKIFNNG